jgi:hypothetical protein
VHPSFSSYALTTAIIRMPPEHIRQSVLGPNGQLVIATTIEYYQQMLNTARPFATQPTYAVSLCNKFIQGLDHRILGLFCWFYPQHSNVHDLTSAYQCNQLAFILAAAVAAKEEVKQMQDIARSMIGQGFYKCNSNCYIRVIGEVEDCYGVHKIIAFDVQPVSSGNNVINHFWR